jgi:membrane-associated phospholipid phosphatase
MKLKSPSKPFPAQACVWAFICVLTSSLPRTSIAQQLPPAPSQQCGFRTPSQCARTIGKDQAAILTSPARLRKKDFLWLAPFAAATGTAFAFDRKALDHVKTDPSRVQDFRTISNVTGIYTPLATIGATFLAGMIKQDDHLRETGFLAGEALADTMVFTEALKWSTNRVRPEASGFSHESGEFWPDGKHYPGGDSFPSGHTAIAFAFAHVVADEYPGWKTSLAAYGLAAATGALRVGGREHFPSDVLVGGALGYLIGGFVYNHHSAAKRHVMFTPMVGGKSVGIVFKF